MVSFLGCFINVIICWLICIIDWFFGKFVEIDNDDKFWVKLVIVVFKLVLIGVCCNCIVIICWNCLWVIFCVCKKFFIIVFNLFLLVIDIEIFCGFNWFMVVIIFDCCCSCCFNVSWLFCVEFCILLIVNDVFIKGVDFVNFKLKWILVILFVVMLIVNVLLLEFLL